MSGISFPVVFAGLSTATRSMYQANGPAPWWVWVILILALILIVYLIVQDVLKKRPAAAPPQAAAPVKSAEPVQPEDLTIIEGIGPKINSVLHQAGILTMAQLAEADVQEIGRLLDEAGLRLADPATWGEQARLAAAKDWDGLQELQDSLKGGRVNPGA